MLTNLFIRRLAPILSGETGWPQTIAGAGVCAALGFLGHVALTPSMGVAFSHVSYLPAAACAGLWFGFRGVAVLYVIGSVLWWWQFWGHVPRWPAQFATFSIGLLMVGVFVAMLKTAAQALDAERRTLAEVRRRYDARTNSSPQLFWATSPSGEPVESSRRMGGETVVSWLEGVHPDDAPYVHEGWRRSLETRQPLNVEYRLNIDGAWRWVRSSAVFDEAGAGSLWYGSTENIDAHRQAEAARGLLMREIDHRARNILSVVQALVRMTPRTDMQTYAHGVESRIVALAGAHSLLASNKWRGADLHALLAQELKPYHGACVLVGPAVAVRPELVQPLALVAHELATNAAKYGALSRVGGTVTVNWSTEGETLCVSWCERGGPTIDNPPHKRGFGSSLIAGSINGDLQFEWAAQGLSVQFKMHDAVV